MILLMRELEASLHSSRKALLALDLAGIESENRQQVQLIRELGRLVQRSPVTVPGRQPVRNRGAWPAPSTEVEKELRQCCSQVLEAARLQAALLARVRAKLRVLANMLAGQSATYGPFGAGDRVSAAPFNRVPVGEI
jgi:hypothetical protein